MHEVAVPGTHQAYGQGWPTWCKPRLDRPHCKNQEMLPQPFSPHRPVPPQMGLRGQIWPSGLREDILGGTIKIEKRHVLILGGSDRLRWCYRPPPLNAQAGTSHPSLSPLWSHPADKWHSHSMEDHHLQLRSCMSPGAGHGEMTPHHTCWGENKKEKNKSNLTWMRSWVMSLHCPWAWPSS